MKIYEDTDITSLVGEGLLEEKLNIKKMNSHNLKVLGGLAVVFIIGGLQAWQGSGGWSAWIDMALPVLLAIEHAVNGNMGK